MLEAKLKIKNKTGLHARPAAMFVETARKFKSEITILKGNNSANAKNILQVLALGIEYGDEIILRVSGEDESDALKELVHLVEEVLPQEDN
ncbi:HPr family phosphocarrier protein [Thermococcus aggregans]|uniref:HPr family phosphocarrier protein n=1 Tax=Thermococcus aggregans TaxID=110163 RepID=A0A9E7MWE0_THEAG|nr:HPr family phosphocarrier protein [Thermococcus aggregans]USS40143.1 HPr family phosphocarrier protein [Thermococcus aggregans]